MGDIRFRSKKDGKVKFTASQKGDIKVIGKDGKVKETLHAHDSGKTETVNIERRDLK
jgi:hypothetical protein